LKQIGYPVLFLIGQALYLRDHPAQCLSHGLPPDSYQHSKPPRRVVQEMLGHSSFTLTGASFRHGSATMQRQAVDRGRPLLATPERLVNRFGVQGVAQQRLLLPQAAQFFASSCGKEVVPLDGLEPPTRGLGIRRQMFALVRVWLSRAGKSSLDDRCCTPLSAVIRPVLQRICSATVSVEAAVLSTLSCPPDATPHDTRYGSSIQEHRFCQMRIL
jgi:hypothetical protein